MRELYNKQLEILHNELTMMGMMCEQAISCSVSGLLENSLEMRQKAISLGKDIQMKQHEIEQFCIRLILREQPVACDLRFITTSQKMTADMDRIGDNAADIAFLYEHTTNEQRVFAGGYIEDMAKAVSNMLSDAVDCFVKNDLEKAKKVILFDDVINNFFDKIIQNFVERITEDKGKNSEIWLDILMTAKYLEKIGDHTKNIARLVVVYGGEMK
jgi:phosphate transport system protein